MPDAGSKKITKRAAGKLRPEAGTQKGAVGITSRVQTRKYSSSSYIIHAGIVDTFGEVITASKFLGLAIRKNEGSETLG